ncbi:unnamed protein product, partial [Sphagnum jensenii]
YFRTQIPEDIRARLDVYIQHARISRDDCARSLRGSLDRLDEKLLIAFVETFLRLADRYWQALTQVDEAMANQLKTSHQMLDINYGNKDMDVYEEQVEWLCSAFNDSRRVTDRAMNLTLLSGDSTRVAAVLDQAYSSFSAVGSRSIDLLANYDMKHVFDVILRQAQSHPSDAAALAHFASCALLLRGDIDSTFKNTNHLNSSGHDAIIKTESSHFHLPFFSRGDSHSSSDHSVPVTEIHNENLKSFKMFASRSASSTHHENESNAQELKRSQKELSLLLTAIASNYETPSTRAKLTPLALVFSQPSICSPAKELRWLLLGVKPRLETSSSLSQHGGALQAVDANVFGSCEEAIRVYKLRIYNLSLNHVHATHKLRPLLQISLGSHVFKSDVAVSNPAADQYNWGNYAVEVNVDSITLNSTLLACELKYKGAVFGSTTVGSVSVPLSGLLVSDIQQESFPLVQKGQNETDDGREMEKSNNTPPSLTLSVELLDRN